MKKASSTRDGEAAETEEAPDLSKRVSDLLKFFLARTRCTNEQLAERVGVSPSLISLLIKGTRKPTSEALQRIASGLGLDPGIWSVPNPRHDYCTIISPDAWTQTKGLLSHPTSANARAGLRWVRVPGWETLPKDDPKGFQLVRYSAHDHMVRRGIYRYLTLQDVDATIGINPKYVRLPANLELQFAILELYPCPEAELVLDAHVGEEVYHVLSGNTKFVFMKGFEFRPERVFAGTQTEVVECKAIVPAEAFDTVIKEHPRDAEYVLANREPIQAGARAPSAYFVPAVRYELNEGSSFTVDSTWPHGGFAPTESKDSVAPARLHMVTFGSSIEIPL